MRKAKTELDADGEFLLKFLGRKRKYRERRLKVTPMFARIRSFLHYIHGRLRHFAARLREAAYRHCRCRVQKIIVPIVLSLCLFAAIDLVFEQICMVYVTDSDGASSVLLVQDESTEEIVRLSGLQVGEYDEYFYTSYSGNRAVLTVQRAYQVSVTADGVTHTAWLNGGTVQDALQQLEITLGPDDYVEPSLHSPLEEGESARVYRVTYTDSVVQTPIPFETEYRYTSLLHRRHLKNRTYVMREGSDGMLETVFRERRVDGVVESSEQIDEYVAVQPVSQQVLAYGAGVPVSKLSAPAGYTVSNNVPSSYQYVIPNAICTAYSSSGGRGASRLGLYAGTVAVNPNVIPYGTMMYITAADGSFVYGWAIATDTGTALMEGIIDIDLYYDTYLESVLNGKKALNVYVIGKVQ